MPSPICETKVFQAIVWIYSEKNENEKIVNVALKRNLTFLYGQICQFFPSLHLYEQSISSKHPSKRQQTLLICDANKPHFQTIKIIQKSQLTFQKVLVNLKGDSPQKYKKTLSLSENQQTSKHTYAMLSQFKQLPELITEIESYLKLLDHEQFQQVMNSSDISECLEGNSTGEDLNHRVLMNEMLEMKTDCGELPGCRKVFFLDERKMKIDNREILREKGIYHSEHISDMYGIFDGDNNQSQLQQQQQQQQQIKRYIIISHFSNFDKDFLSNYHLKIQAWIVLDPYEEYDSDDDEDEDQDIQGKIIRIPKAIDLEQSLRSATQLD